jgi:hypothetical protein
MPEIAVTTEYGLARMNITVIRELEKSDLCMNYPEAKRNKLF